MDSVMFYASKMINIRYLAHMRRARVMVVVVVLLLMAETPAAAYTDPGSGALLWQILVAGFVGAMFYWRKLTRWFRSKAKD